MHDKQLAVLLYDSRSGSTFLSRLLDEQPDVSVTIESRFLVYLMDAFKNVAVSDLPAHLAEKDFRFKNFFLHPDAYDECAQSADATDVQQVAQCFLAAYFAADINDTCIVKCGMMLPRVLEVAKCYPDMKFVHIVRDGRAVMNSKMRTKKVYRKGYMADNVMRPARRWRDYLGTVDELHSRHSGRVLEVRYEDLMAFQERELGRIRGFLGLSKEVPSGAKGASDYARRIPEAEKSLHANVGGAAIQANADKWKHQLSKSDIMVYEFLNRSLLKAKGYEPMYSKGGVLVRPTFWWALFRNYFRHILFKVRCRLNPELRQPRLPVEDEEAEGE